MTGLIIHLPDFPTEDRDTSEELAEQVIAQAFADYDMDVGRIEAERDRTFVHDGWEYGEPCPECGSERLGETCLSHGMTYVGLHETPDGDEYYNVTDYDEESVGEQVVVECQECNTLIYRGHIVRPEE